MTVHQPGELLHIRVDQLAISPRNVRKTPSSTISELAASIRTHGVMQNLTVAATTSKKRGAAPFEVIDGGRRLRALQQLVSEGDLPRDFEVLCTLRDSADATELSTAGNMHEGMHPADEFDAFQALINEGRSVEDVAARFGVTPLVVRRRLKLANVSPRLIAEYRAGKIALDQLTALAISDNHADQEAVWDAAHGWKRSAEHLREALRGKDIDAAKDPLARFVGLEAYEAAGGPLTRDLFSAGGGFISDAALLRRLASEKLEAIADTLRTEGWSWVEVRERIDYSERHSYGQSQAKHREPTSDETKLLAQLEAQARQLSDDIERVDEPGEDLVMAFEGIEAKIENLKASFETFTERQKSRSGAIVTLDYNGSLEILRGLIKPAANGKKPKDLPAEDDDSSSGPTPKTEESPTLSATLIHRLTAHRTAALQALIAESPSVALTALLYALVSDVFTRFLSGGWERVAKVSLTNQRGSASAASPHDMESSRAWQSMEASVARWEDRLPKDGEDLFAWLAGLSQADQLDLLAVCVAHSINTFEQREDPRNHERANQLADALSLDMADWWEPTAGSYLASVPKPLRMAAVREAVGEEASNGLASMKKDAMIAAAEDQLRGTRWVPPLFRRSTLSPKAQTASSKRKKKPMPAAAAGVRATAKRASTAPAEEFKDDVWPFPINSRP